MALINKIVDRFLVLLCSCCTFSDRLFPVFLVFVFTRCWYRLLYLAPLLRGSYFDGIAALAFWTATLRVYLPFHPVSVPCVIILAGSRDMF